MLQRALFRWRRGQRVIPLNGPSGMLLRHCSRMRRLWAALPLSALRGCSSQKHHHPPDFKVEVFIARIRTRLTHVEAIPVARRPAPVVPHSSASFAHRRQRPGNDLSEWCFAAPLSVRRQTFRHPVEELTQQAIPARGRSCATPPIRNHAGCIRKQ